MSAVVVGGSSGIGLEAARLFVEEGAKVAIVGRQQHRLDKATAAFTGNIIAVSADVSRPDEINLAMQQIVDRTGPIDVLFVSAGVSDAPPFSQTTEAAFDHLIGINLKGTFFAVLHALPHLRDGASVILTGSVAGRKGRPGDPLYAASKGAVRSFGRTLATSEEILARRIRVNVLTPGPIVTPLTAEATEIPAVRDFIAEMVPLGRWGEAREVAQVVKFLASDASSYITGAEITVDGGLAHV
ncbi:SDR family NAD(P)-dependent oxidoreductase [Paraburkholderia caledonica]|uniref:SDR family NAD(P)-dependent oxidoreductase n=1 Tax=Paraburkholderia caledonica TaxID=134536 RepID=UPI000361C5EB|nr:SDR family oxidoreductase [Paraburkholderia caledonica]